MKKDLRMQSINTCHECGKRYPKPPKQCMCGWHFTKQEPERNDPLLCQFFMNGEQCKELGTVSFRTKGSDWYCGDHARMLREESYKR